MIKHLVKLALLSVDKVNFIIIRVNLEIQNLLTIGAPNLSTGRVGGFRDFNFKNLFLMFSIRKARTVLRCVILYVILYRDASHYIASNRWLICPLLSETKTLSNSNY
jgi:hypothetical protein